MSLAQDRGRLEARIEVLGAELETQKKQNERNTDVLKIKTKIVDDQTETIRKLKEVDVLTVPPPTSFFLSSFYLESHKKVCLLCNLSSSKAVQERADQIRKIHEEAAEAQKKVQQQLDAQTAQQAELREQLDHLSVRKEELKQQLEDKHAELEDVKQVYKLVKKCSIFSVNDIKSIYII